MVSEWVGSPQGSTHSLHPSRKLSVPVEVSDPCCTSAVFWDRRAPCQEDKEMTKPETSGFIRLTASFAAGSEVIINVKSKLGFPNYILNGGFR